MRHSQGIDRVGGMPFQPDIIVNGPDGIALVVEAKTNLSMLETAEKEIERYMIGMQCPIGILTSPERMLVYRDAYSFPPSVERIGDFDMNGVWGQQPPEDAASFEVFVQNWLEDLASQYTGRWPKQLRVAVRDYILPATAAGEVRAAHPRYT